jgi:biopolymer transport protein ExbB
MGPGLAVEADGHPGEDRRDHPVHHVRLVHRRDDRSLDGIQRRA